jgi:hypothetical protein
MQIYELTTRQPVDEISFKDIGKALGKALVQAPLKALGNKVGADLIGDEKTKSATELKYDLKKYFGFAKQQFYRGMPEHIIISELIGKYGANQEQATKALEAAQQQLQSISQLDPQTRSQAGSQTFGTMANQLGQTGNAPPAPQSPEEIRKAKQAVAARAVQTNMTANSTPAPTPVPANPAVPNTNYQMPTGMQTTSNAKTTMASPASATPPPTNLPIPKYNTVTPPAAPTTAATIPAQPEPISIGGQNIKPIDPLYSKIQKQLAQQKSAAVAESLIWSRKFDPSATLLKKIKQS